MLIVRRTARSLSSWDWCQYMQYVLEYQVVLIGRPRPYAFSTWDEASRRGLLSARIISAAPLPSAGELLFGCRFSDHVGRCAGTADV